MTYLDGGKWAADSYLHEISLLLGELGPHLLQYRESFLLRRIEIRIKRTQARTHEDYLRLLKENPSERDALMELFSINVTEFFRDDEFYNVLRSRILPDLSEIAKRQGHISVWCAGCATGEEPYSLAILIMETLGPETRNFEIIATDRNPVAIQVARAARYQASSIRRVPADLTRKYFNACESSIFEVKQHVRERVKFSVADISTLETIRPFDAISCRNVMIYMTREARTALLGRFSRSLTPGGYLMLGQSEMIMGEAASFFEPLFPRARIYTRREAVRARQAVSS